MRLANKNILIVEDNSLNRVVYHISLVRSGAHFEFDIWGREIIRKLNQYEKWDLIILDLMLPSNVSGFEIFQEIRAIQEFDHIPIIAVSATDVSTALPKAKELGFDGFISKPIDEARFADQIADVLDGKEVWADMQ